jgi:hypothetical protein
MATLPSTSTMPLMGLINAKPKVLNIGELEAPLLPSKGFGGYTSLDRSTMVTQPTPAVDSTAPAAWTGGGQAPPGTTDSSRTGSSVGGGGSVYSVTPQAPPVDPDAEAKRIYAARNREMDIKERQAAFGMVNREDAQRQAQYPLEQLRMSLENRALEASTQQQADRAAEEYRRSRLPRFYR